MYKIYEIETDRTYTYKAMDISQAMYYHSLYTNRFNWIELKYGYVLDNIYWIKK